MKIYVNLALAFFVSVVFLAETKVCYSTPTLPTAFEGNTNADSTVKNKPAVEYTDSAAIGVQEYKTGYRPPLIFELAILGEWVPEPLMPSIDRGEKNDSLRDLYLLTKDVTWKFFSKNELAIIDSKGNSIITDYSINRHNIRISTAPLHKQEQKKENIVINTQKEELIFSLSGITDADGFISMPFFITINNIEYKLSFIKK